MCLYTRLSEQAWLEKTLEIISLNPGADWSRVSYSKLFMGIDYS